MNNVSEQMRDDWNERAREDVHYYVAFGARGQDEEAFLATAEREVGAIRWELKRLPRDANRRAWRALEIGCGPGRLMRPLSADFGEIHGVDVSDEMVRIARGRLRDIPHAHVHATNGALLDLFADESFDIVYSYAVFQHIPSRDVVLSYMREIRRVLKPGGVFRGQFNGLPLEHTPNTWIGVTFSPDDIRAFTMANGLQLLALETMYTQYMWTTWRKPLLSEAGYTDRRTLRIRRITNAWSSEPVVPDRGPLAAMSVWVTGLPDGMDLNNLDVRIDGVSGTPVYVGPPESDGLQQVNVIMPAGVRTGLVPVDMLGSRTHVRVIPAGPIAPRITSVTDGINLCDKNRSTTGTVKVQVDEMPHAEPVEAFVDGKAVRDLYTSCTDPMPPRYDINFRLPEGITPGRHDLRIAIGRRVLSPVEIEVSVAPD